jgi:hypothetical protein
MKQKLNYFLSLFCVLLLFSCSEEKDYIEKSSSGSLKKISFEEFQRNSKAMRTFNVIEIKTRMAKSSQRIIFDSINNFSIDTDKIIIAEKDGKICYTILIERPYATSKTENLVLEEAEDGFYIPFIFSYDLDNIDKEKAQNHELISDLFSKLLVTKPEDLNLEDFLEIANRTTICITVQVAYCTTGNHNSSNLNGDENGNYACTAVGYREQTMCYSDGGGGGSTAGGNTGTGYTSYGGGTNGGGVGPDTSNPTQTAPPPPNNNTANQNQIITLPLVDLEEETIVDPCKDLKHLVDPRPDETIINDGDTINIKRPRLKTVLNSLRGNLGGTKESGIELRYSPTLKEYSWNYATVTSANKNSDIELSIGGSVYGGAHVHTKYLHGIPSFGDIVWLRDCMKLCFTPSKNMLVCIIICKNPKFGQPNEPETSTYALKVNDFTNLDKKIENKFSQTPGETKEDKLKEILKQDSKINDANLLNLESKFLEMYGSMGFELFKANDGLTDWNKLTRNQNGTTASNPCN